MAPDNFLDKMNAVKVGPKKAPAVAVEEEAEGEEDTLLGPVTFLFQGVKVVGGFPAGGEAAPEGNRKGEKLVVLHVYLHRRTSWYDCGHSKHTGTVHYSLLKCEIFLLGVLFSGLAGRRLQPDLPQDEGPGPEHRRDSQHPGHVGPPLLHPLRALPDLQGVRPAMGRTYGEAGGAEGDGCSNG